MIGRKKAFDARLHSRNDPKTRKLVKKFFKQFNVILTDHVNKYDVDLITEDGQIKVEVERRLNWEGEKFPYDTVHVLERKKKFFLNGDTHYCIISKDNNYLGFISARVIQRYMVDTLLKNNPNKYVQSGEYVYPIPTAEFEFYKLN